MPDYGVPKRDWILSSPTECMTVKKRLARDPGKALIDLGVDDVWTDFPAMAVDVLGEKETG